VPASHAQAERPFNKPKPGASSRLPTPRTIDHPMTAVRRREVHRGGEADRRRPVEDPKRASIVLSLWFAQSKK
jgi:hypothetical protein